METYSEYLAHHGILGMRWGKRNGPPYPLNASQMSVKEKKLNSNIPNVKITADKGIFNRHSDAYKEKDLHIIGIEKEKEEASKQLNNAFNSIVEFEKQVDDELIKYGKPSEERSALIKYLKENVNNYDDFDDLALSADEFFDMKLNNDRLKSAQKHAMETVADSMRANEQLVKSIIGQYGDTPVAKRGRYSDVSYERLVKDQLDPHHLSSYIWYYDKNLLGGDPYGSMPSLANYPMYSESGANLYVDILSDIQNELKKS